MIILGIDPGTARTGWGIIKRVESSGKTKTHELKTTNWFTVEYVAHGCIVTQKEMEMGKRLILLRRELRKILAQFAPECVVIERLFFGRNLLTAITVGQAKGVVIMTVAEHSRPVFEYTGLSAKLFLTGDGRADKKIVQKYIRRLLKRTKRHLPFSAKDRGFDDAADGLAIAILHASRISVVETVHGKGKVSTKI